MTTPRRLATQESGGVEIRRPKDGLEIAPNLWAGIGLVRGGAGHRAGGQRRCCGRPGCGGHPAASADDSAAAARIPFAAGVGR
ncbi:hypothetical protein ACFW1M_02720 [Streptomyces inhibens]|uniref:hypothetical protein n=1 Tax=Streptomyces inhibens TaxID=2293571 RepID=UPI0036C63EFC